MTPTPKRKHKTLTIAEKCAILDGLKGGVSATSLSLKYGVGKSTITDLKKKEQKIRSFVAQTEKGPGLRKTLKSPENPVLEEALFTWFLELGAKTKACSFIGRNRNGKSQIFS